MTTSPWRRLAVGTAFVAAFATLPVRGQLASPIEDAAHAGTSTLTQQQVASLLASGSKRDLDLVRRLGMLVFAVPFNRFDGLGDGPYDPGEGTPTALGHRPTLQGNGMFLRFNGLDAQACNECHSIVSNATRPPTLGVGGVGSAVQSAFFMPTMVDVADSADNRVAWASGHEPDLALANDGRADFNGRFINPPFLFGGGGVELLAKEMTAALQVLLRKARSSAAGEVLDLDTHGVHFGTVTALGGGEVDLRPEGIGLGIANANANAADRSPEEVLVVRPFGRKGEAFSMRDFDRVATQFHFGIQPVEVVGADVDEDNDGVANEVTVGEMSALHVFDVTNPVPRQESRSAEARQGAELFESIGCSSCHRPVMTTVGRTLPLAHPEIASDPNRHVYARIDLVAVGFEPSGSGIAVPLFADLKRHEMGARLAEDCEVCTDVPNDEFTTARLWGVADTAPYLHDGRATTLFDAIEMHGGEAQGARDDFMGLGEHDQSRILAFLKTLRTPRRPNEELVTRRSWDR